KPEVCTGHRRLPTGHTTRRVRACSLFSPFPAVTPRTLDRVRYVVQRRRFLPGELLHVTIVTAHKSEHDAEQRRGSTGALAPRSRGVDGGNRAGRVEVVVEALAHLGEQLAGRAVGGLPPAGEPLGVAVGHRVLP